MKNIPEKIYLQVDADGETPENFDELSGITWAAQRIHENDIEYVLADSVLKNASDKTKAELYDVMYDTTFNPES